MTMYDRLTTANGLLSCTILGIGTTILLSFLAATSQAQDFERYRPKTPDNREGESRLPDEPKQATGDARVLVGELKALIFVDHRDRVVPGKIQAQGIEIRSDEGLDILDSEDFHAVVEPYLGRPISLLRLNQMVREIILFYRDNDQPVVDVSVPEQDITDGVVQVVVTEGRVGNIRIEEACFFNPCRLERYLCTMPGDAIYESQLLDDLRYLNRNPFRSVDLELTPGDAFGETDIVFNVHDERPLRAYVGYEDTGTRQTGLERILLGANWGNAFGLDHSFGAQYTASTDFETLEAYSGVYDIPLANRDSITFYGSFAEINSDQAIPFGVRGTAWQMSIRYNYNLCPICDFEHYLTVGFDFKRTNTNLDLGGVLVSATNADIAQLAFGWHGAQYDDCGSFAVGADLYVGPGSGFSSGNNDASFQTLRFAAEAEYVYSRMYVERQVYLPWNLSLLGRATGQIAEGNLLPSEQLGFGGYNSIRGYDMRVVNGDSGYFFNLELRTDPISTGLCCGDELQFLTFYDVGDSRNHTTLPFEDPSVDLNSAGVGLNYSLSQTFQARVEYGWQLNDLGFPGFPRQRWHVGMIASY